MNLNSFIDHTLLKPEATGLAHDLLCQQAVENSFATVCVNGVWVPYCHQILKHTPVKVCTVVGFPLGATTTESKANEAKAALEQGATEVDMVIHIGSAKEGCWSQIEAEIKKVKQACSDHILKVIIETSLLTEIEKIELTKVVSQSGAEFIKTSTGFSTTGATLADIEIFKKHRLPHLKIKASGGIKTKEQALQFIQAGCDRLGTSSGVQICSDGLSASTPNDY